MKRTVVLTSIVVMLLAGCLWTLDAWARAGGGKSTGSRGSRSWSAPQSSPSDPSSSRQTAPTAPFQQPRPQRSGWMGGLMGGITGFVLGGLIGSMLFGHFGGGLFGGIGLLELLLIGGGIFFVLSYLRRRQQSATSYGYGPPQGVETPSWQSESMSASTATMAAPESDLERGIRHIHQMDSAFDPASFTDTAPDVFCAIQAAWMARDMGPARHLLTPEMYETMHKECDRMRVERRVNRLENIAVRAIEVTEAWQESGLDFVTVHFLGTLLDYMVDEVSNQVLEGSHTTPVMFEAYWTFMRPVGANAWKLSAIQQLA